MYARWLDAGVKRFVTKWLLSPASHGQTAAKIGTIQLFMSCYSLYEDSRILVENVKLVVGRSGRRLNV